MRLFHLLTDLAIPKSLFESGNYRLAKDAARSYPFSVKRGRGNQTQQPEGDYDDDYDDNERPEIPEKHWKSLF